MKYFYYCEYDEPHLKPNPESAYFDFYSEYKIQHNDCLNSFIDEFTCEWLSDGMAKDFLSNHDGWECKSWNEGSHAMVFFVFDENKKFLFANKVYLKFEPSFSSRKYEVEL